jgi:hypothetical protein
LQASEWYERLAKAVRRSGEAAEVDESL